MCPVSGRGSSRRSTSVDRADVPGPDLPQLAARAQLGDCLALETLLRRLADPLRAHIAFLTRDTDRAEDLLQDVLLRIAGKLSDLREHRWVRAWAYRIATREALRQVARERRVALISLEAAEGIPADEPLEDPLLRGQLLSAVAALPEASQLVIRLHYLDGLTQPEVAEVLGIPIGTVKSRIAYGLGRLRERLRTGAG